MQQLLMNLPEALLSPPPRPNSSEVRLMVDHLFRREAGRLVAILTRYFGVANLHLAEDVVQDALVKAMETWPFTGVPESPSAWLLQAAKNRALDQTRRGTLWRGKQAELAPLMEDCLYAALAPQPPRFEDEINDSQLRMMFVCCYPGLPAEAQVALILKTLCGFGEKEIAAAFIDSPAAVTKRLVRARQFLRENGVTIELPAAAELIPRVEVVQQALYLLFNEGYKASRGDSLLRTDLCAEAIRLAQLLSTHPAGDQPSTHALLALMHLNAARNSARVDHLGEVLLMAEQDRGLWDRDQIGRGMRELEVSGCGDRVTRYHLEAGIAACHVLAKDFAATDWRRIVTLYDQLLEVDQSPVVALNRAVALAKVEGPRIGLNAIEAITGREALESYHLFHAVMGQLWLETGETRRAADYFRRSIKLTTLPAERTLLEKRLSLCGADGSDNC
jgi:RNA polymerase sigma factor (sigma-70 family)